MTNLLFIAAGGALGALARYGVNNFAVTIAGHDFPWATLSVNVAGSFLMGAIAAIFAHVGEALPQELRMFALTGFLGAFTTFSAFSLDAVSLWQRGDFMHAALYVCASVIISIAALALGLWLGRAFS